ncbi:MAG: transglutaminase domain-containing protein, partial [Bacteroidota bacterium]
MLNCLQSYILYPLLLLCTVLPLSLMSHPSEKTHSADKWSHIDRHALAAPKSIQQNLHQLHDYLVIPCKTPTEKLRSFYIWIIHNISYDKRALDLKTARINRNLGAILQRRKAICMGYSQLLEAFCNKAGIPNEIISGYVRIEDTPLQLERPDHTWNAVLLGGQWRLVEPTWAANYAQHAQKKVRAEHEQFFLSAPDDFLVNHLPQFPIWQLSDCPIGIEDFRQMKKGFGAIVPK